MKKIDCKLEPQDALHIGSGVVGLGARHVSRVQRLNGRPFVPGSTLKGKMRANLTRLLPSIRELAKGDLQSYLEDKSDKSVIRDFFGAEDRKGRITVTNAVMEDSQTVEQEDQVDVIPGIRIDEETRSTAEGALFFEEKVAPKKNFEFSVYIAKSKQGDVDLLLTLLPIKYIERTGIGRRKAGVTISIPEREAQLDELKEALLGNE
ncbi:MAG: hypothetical protein GF309_04295 [Candidatus Lokiarchaeota archaeon]|nr:hypothetical protein [Candidatus Lokiarchaeota archaeon]